MKELGIARTDFTILRTPADLDRYVKEAYSLIAADQAMRKNARLHKEPYKAFLEEVLPFSHFCTWKYTECRDVLCALTSDTSRHGTPGQDASVRDPISGEEHSVELTWPVDGSHMFRQALQMNEQGHTEFEIYDYDDVSRQKEAVERTLAIAKKKCLRDYRSQGGSTIIFIFDRSLFWDDNPKHIDLLNSMRKGLSSMPFLVDEVLLMLVFGDQKQIIRVESTEHVASVDASHH
jgi:hypothetical protein